jgi:hypothetical protein
MRSLTAVAFLFLASLGAVPALAQTVDWRTWERYMESGRGALSQGREAGRRTGSTMRPARRSGWIPRARSSPPR